MIDIRPLTLAGTYEIKLKPLGDERGYFLTTYQQRAFEEAGLVTGWVQENQSLSTRQGVIRGLHFQAPPHAQTKLVRVLLGAALDVFVDIRRGSPTYGQWDAIELSDVNHRAVYVPQGFAHGFCTLAERVLIAYKVDDYYAPENEGGLMWNDPDLGIDWPTTTPALSGRDQAWPPFAEFVSPFG
jgi:dTDP-4-dehydrorhamnose 3,5-epimerase